MKKLLKLSAIFLFAFMLLGIPSVLATEIQNPDTSTSEPYTYNGYKWTVTGLKLKVYQIDNSKTESETTTTTNGDSTMTSTVETNEDIDKYLDEEPTRVISLPLSSPLEPTYKEDKFRDMDALYIDLNYDITKEELEELLATEIANATDNIGYIVDFVVSYRFFEMPEGLNYHYKYNFARKLFEMFRASEKQTASPRINMLDENEQVINMIEIFKDTDDDTANLDYYEKVEDGAEYGVLNFQVLSKKELSEDSEDDLTAADGYVIMFHNVNDIDYLIRNVNHISEVAEEEASEIYDEAVKTTEQEVAVDNTAATYPLYIYVLSAIGILVGVLIISSEILQSKNKKQVQQ